MSPNYFGKLSFKLNNDRNKFIYHNIFREKGLIYGLAVSIKGKTQSLEII